MKPTLLLILSCILFSCSEQKVEYDENFYEPLPFDGFKGNIESVTTLRYSQSEGEDMDSKPNFSGKITTFYTKDGKRDSIYSVNYNANDTIKSSLKYYYEGKHLVKTMEERRNSTKERIIETIYERIDKENIKILKTDLLENDLGPIPDGFLKFDFEEQSTTMENTRDMEVEMDIIETTTHFFKDRKGVRYQYHSPTLMEGKKPTIGHIEYDENGRVSKITHIDEKFFLFSKRTDVTYQYLDFDKQGNYTEVRMTPNDDDRKIIFVEKLELKYRE